MSPDPRNDDVVLAAWSPAGWGRTVVVLDRGVVIHKIVLARPSRRGSPFIAKVLRHGVPGLLASRRMTLVPWDQIISAEYRALALYRGRMVIATPHRRHTLKFTLETIALGDPVMVFAVRLGDRFTGPPAT